MFVYTMQKTDVERAVWPLATKTIGLGGNCVGNCCDAVVACPCEDEAGASVHKEPHERCRHGSRTELVDVERFQGSTHDTCHHYRLQSRAAASLCSFVRN